MRYSHILVTTDLSHEAAKAFETARHFAQRENARVSLVTVITQEITSLPVFEHIKGIDYSTTFHKQLEMTAARELEKIATSMFDGIQVDTRVLNGSRSAATAILEYAKKSECDLIVMSSHGAGILATVLLGSVVQKVIRHAPCPVVVIPVKG